MLTIIKRLIPKRLFKLLQPLYHLLVSFIAAVYYGFPSNKLIVIGVTGTAGKTSTVYFIAKILEKAGYKTGFTSTTIFSFGDQEYLNNKKMTMPGRFFVQRSLAKMVNNSCRFAIIETTSEGIKQYRHRFINYDTVLFTNLYPEHIESHGSYENYKKAKGKLFKYLKSRKKKYINKGKKVIVPSNNFNKLNLDKIGKSIIVNGDDQEYKYFLNFWSEYKTIYTTSDYSLQSFFSESFQNTSLVSGKVLESSFQGIQIMINNVDIQLNLLGEINIYNALAATSVAMSYGIEMKVVKDGLESITGLAGKMEKIEEGQDYTAIVDYSFEPKAVEKLYQTIEAIPHNKVIHLLGSTGGGRDQSRRSVLGEMAGNKADYVIIANEDPYDEDPWEIINEVAQGAEKAGKVKNVDLFLVLDRREAIQKAISLAQTGDLVLFTGKGSEQYICIEKGKRIAWDEREEVKETIKSSWG